MPTRQFVLLTEEEGVEQLEFPSEEELSVLRRRTAQRGEYFLPRVGVAPPPFLEPLPTAFSWRDLASIPIKNQGNFGTCAAFSVVGVIEAARFRMFGDILDLSEQDYINKLERWNHQSPYSDGAALIEELGVRLESESPYTGDNNVVQVSKDNDPKLYRPTPYRFVKSEAVKPERIADITTQDTIGRIKAAIRVFGPAHTLMYPSEQFKDDLDLSTTTTSGSGSSHLINLVGWDDSRGAWHVRNSWGTGWKDGGYGYISYLCPKFPGGCVFFDAIPTVLHLSGVTSSGSLWHTIRNVAGSWFSFGDVEGQTGDRGSITRVDLHGVGPDVHLVAISGTGGIFHTIRKPDGSWFPFGNIETHAGDRGLIRGVGATAVDLDLHVCVTSSDGRIWHTVRRVDGAWLRFGDVASHAGDRGIITEVDCAAIGDQVHVCAVSVVGRLWHTIRLSDGSWLPFGDIEGQAGDRGHFIDVSCVNISGNLHVCGVSIDGRLWHTIRRTDGSWFRFGDVEGQTGDRGFFKRVSCGDVGGALHVAGVTSDGRLWHAVRHTNGSWTKFGDVEGQAGERGLFVDVSVGGSFTL